MFTSATVLYGGSAVEFNMAGGRTVKFHSVWLRYFAPHESTFDLDNGDRIARITDIARHTVILSATIEGPEVRVEFFPDNIVVRYEIDWLLANRYDTVSADQPGWLPDDLMMWDSRITNTIEFVEYDQIREDRLILSWWLKSVQQTGVGALKNCPILAGGLIGIADLFGKTRTGPAGEWSDERVLRDFTEADFRRMNHQVETNHAFWEHAPSMQLLYCLENLDEGTDVLLVDGFEAVQRLKRKRPDYFDVLSGQNARWGAVDDDGVYHSAKHPVIELGPDGELVAVRYSNRTASPLIDIPYPKMPAYLDAYMGFSKILDDERLVVTLTLQAGDCLLLDNARVLSAPHVKFSPTSYWLQRCFVDSDSVVGTLNAIEADLY